ncbi:MAG TPA: carbohydrate-binding protein, partial [Burkholderiaceae bacterium]
PLASFAPARHGDDGPAPELALDTGLDPICALSVRLTLAPHGKLQLTFCTAVSDNPITLDAVIDKYRQHSAIERASLMSATLTGIRLRELNVNAESYAAIQTLTTAVVMNVTRQRAAVAGGETDAADVCDRRLLWRFGISGDRPIVLVSAGAPQGMGLLRRLVQALRMWSWAGVACDLVVVNAEPTSYLMALQRDVSALREQFTAQNSGQPGAGSTSFHVLRADEVSADELGTLRKLARVNFNADGRPLTHHMLEWSKQHEDAFEERHATSIAALPIAAGAGTAPRAPQGRFMPEGGEFRFDVSVFQRPARPWVNVLANPGFGAQLSEAGGGYTWALNSRLNQLTPWSNDAVADPPGEWFLLQDLKTRELWTVSPSAWGYAPATYRIAHGQGYSVATHRRGDLEVSAAWCVDAQTAVKQVRLRLVNRGHRTQRLRAIGIAEWVMGAQRGDRATTDTASFTQRLPGGPRDDATPAAAPRKLNALTCTQRDASAGFGAGTAFLAVTTGADEAPEWTCDRRECFDARGRLAVPDHYGQRSGAGLDPCAAIATLVTLGAGESVECVFLLGFGANPVEARQLATAAVAVPAKQRLDQVRASWDALLGATTVQTPDPLFDAMVNRWLLYQTVACRLWARAGFYQAGGAFGFRDQLQDAMALAWAAPAMLRQQIVLNASRQFVEGDVQHWWHAPTGAGVRTHFSDDLLWLPHACAHYLRCTGDTTLLDESVPFIEGAAIPPGAEDAYYVPSVSSTSASVYEHGARAIDRSLKVGAHGLPLMGSGDWNDGMNRVGIEGRGESVWLAWFLCGLVDDYA